MPLTPAVVTNRLLCNPAAGLYAQGTIPLVHTSHAFSQLHNLLHQNVPGSTHAKHLTAMSEFDTV